MANDKLLDCEHIDEKDYLIRNMPNNLHKALRVEAAEGTTTMRALILRAIEDYTGGLKWDRENRNACP